MIVRDILQFLQKNNVVFGFIGNPEVSLSGYSSLYHYKPGTFAWARDQVTFKSSPIDMTTRIALLITSFDNDGMEYCAAKILSKDPRSVFFSVIDHFWGVPAKRGISESAIIETGATIGENVTIGQGCVISSGTIIGCNSILGANVVTIGRVEIGRDCNIQSGVVIGEDGMALVKDDGNQCPIPHYGGVLIGNRVYIGANTCICRGTVEDTILENDVKIDKLCHIAHNCILGERSLLMAGTILLSSVEVGNDTRIHSAIVKEQRDVGSHVLVAHGTVVTQKLADGVLAQGNPMSVMRRK